MPPNPRVVQAFRAMRSLGIAEDKVKPVLKSLLKLYDKNWELIEVENYRVLVDAIFENEESEGANKKKPASTDITQEQEEDQEPDEVEQPLKRSRFRYQQEPMQYDNGSSSQLPWTSPMQTEDNCVNFLEIHAPEKLSNMIDEPELRNGDRRIEAEHANSQMLDRSKRKQPASPSSLVIPEISASPNPTSADIYNGLYPQTNVSQALTESGPIPLVHPEIGYLGCSSKKNSHTGTAREQEKAQLQLASSSSGEVKLSLSYSLSSLGSGFHVPSVDEVLKAVEDKCLRTYKISDPNFSVLKVMEDTCECLLQLKSQKAQTETQIAPNVELSNFVHPPVSTQMPSDHANGLPDTQPVSRKCDDVNEMNKDLLENEQNVHDDPNSKSLVCVQQYQLTADDACSFKCFSDVCKGQESVVISLVNDVNNKSPPSFNYIPENVVFQNANVNFSLARIEDTRSCSMCFGDCLSLPTPCACAHETGGEFAYTVEGLVKDEFIEECISMNRDHEKHCRYFCKECPLERSKKEDIIKPCRGHLVRKFIKECWWKCGCNKQCGNRVVQRGITRNLQVFMTNGKGWGLRTLEDLPKGTFVCEYVGEILTTAELFDRVSKSHKGEGQSYPMLLDADWSSERVLKDEEALCLDATNYGNVARFINHRCFDPTLVAIPVEIETHDHHYYHLAFFTTRKVKAMEELTWDYGIDFDDHIHPMKAFQCLCGSPNCRYMGHPNNFTRGNTGENRDA